MSELTEVGPRRGLDTITIVTPGFRGVHGGLEAHVSALVKGLAAQGTKVIVLTARRGIDRTEMERHDDCWVVTYPAWSISSMSVSPRLVVAAIRSRRRDRVLHVHGYHATTTLALVGRRAPTVFTPHYHGNHGHSHFADLLHVPYYRLTKWLVRRCAAVICVSEAERATWVTDFPATADRVAVIPNGIDAKTIRAARPFPTEPPTVLCVGRIEPYKRIDDVVRAFSLVPAPAQLVIVGDGSQRQEIGRLAVDLGVADRVRLLGTLSDAELHRWLRTARVFVSLSEREAFGMAPVEAACGGARIILSDIPAHREIADAFLRRCVTVLTDLATASVAAEIRRLLEVSRSETSSAPDWSEIITRTIDVYLTSGAVPGMATEINADRLGTSSPRHWGLET